MQTIFKLTLKSATRDPFLLFYSILLPIGGTIGFGMFMKSPEYPEHMVTGLMAASIVFYSFMTTSFAILTQRRRGVYNLLRVTPLALWEYLCSISGAWTLISLGCALLVLVSGSFIFGFAIAIGTIVALIPMILVATSGYVFLSFVIASISRTENNVSIFTNSIALPLILCSSGFYSLDTAPQWIRGISQCNPFQWFLNGLRSSFVLDWPSYSLNLGLLMCAGAVALFLALRTFRYADI